MQAGREIGWLEFYRELGIDCSGGPPQVAYAWDSAGLSPTDRDDDRLVAAANLLSPTQWQEVEGFLNGPEAAHGHSRDGMGGITFDWNEVLPELCWLYKAGVRLENRFLGPWFGLSTSEVLDAIDRGFRHRDAYVGHEHTDLTPMDLATAAHQQGIPAEFAQQTSAYLSINGMRTWLQCGLSAERISEWVIAGYAPDEAVEWNAAGVPYAEDAEGWARVECGPDEAASWLHCGFQSPVEAQSWARAVTSPEIAARLRAAGIVDVRELDEWDPGLGYETIARRRVAGIRPRH